jgi:hypothetical protein
MNKCTKIEGKSQERIWEEQKRRNLKIRKIVSCGGEDGMNYVD